MDQLVQLIHQRHIDITSISNHISNNLPQLLIKQKQRTHKQNWVLKILKSIKVLTPQLKSDIYYKSQQMMNISQNILISKSQNLDQNFTQKIINLYIDFFNTISSKSTPNNYIKTLIRPNNSYIIIDLIKSLIELERKKFRQNYILRTNLQDQLKSPRKKVVFELQNEQHQNQSQIKQIKQIQLMQKSLYKKKMTIYNPQQMIKRSLKQKYMNFIRMIDIKSMQNRINIIFIDVKQRNLKNGYMIDKFRYKCLGQMTKKHTNYNLAGLYTIQQLKQIQNKLTKNKQQFIYHQKYISISNNQFNINHQPNQQNQQNQQIKYKSNAIKQFQHLQILYHYTNKSSKKLSTIQKWLPLLINKKLSKQNPWEICVINNKSKIKSSSIIQDPEINNIGLKQFLINKLNQFFIHTYNYQNQLLQKSQQENRLFDKKCFIDYGKKKQRQLIQGDKYLLKKQLFFPPIKQNNQQIKHYSLKQQPKHHLIKQQSKSYSINNQTKNNIKRKQLINNIVKKQINNQIIKQQKKENKFKIRKSKSQQKYLPRFIKYQQTDNSIIMKKHINISLIQNNHIHNSQSMIRSKEIQRQIKVPVYNIKTPQLSLKISKNSMEQILNDRIVQRKIQLQQQNRRYQNRIKLLFGSDIQRAQMKIKNKNNKSSLIGITNCINNHFLQ